MLLRFSGTATQRSDLDHFLTRVLATGDGQSALRVGRHSCVKEEARLRSSRTRAGFAIGTTKLPLGLSTSRCRARRHHPLMASPGRPAIRHCRESRSHWVSLIAGVPPRVMQFFGGRHSARAGTRTSKMENTDFDSNSMECFPGMAEFVLFRNLSVKGER
jgi:hypothetical protein